MLNAFAATELARHPCQHTRCRAHAGYWTLTQAGLAWCCLLYTCLLQSGAVSTGMQAVVHDGDSASLGASSTTVKTTHVSLASGGNVHVAGEARQRRGGSLRSKPSVEGGRRRKRQVNQTILVRTPPAPLREVLVETNRVTRRRERKLRSLAPVTQVQRKRTVPSSASSVLNCAAQIADGNFVSRPEGWLWSDTAREKCGLHNFDAREAREMLAGRHVAFLGNSVQRRTMHAIIDLLSEGFAEKRTRRITTEIIPPKELAFDERIVKQATEKGSESFIMDYPRGHHGAQFVFLNVKTGERRPAGGVLTGEDVCGVPQRLDFLDDRMWMNRKSRERGDAESWTMENIAKDNSHEIVIKNGTCITGCRDGPMRCAKNREPPTAAPGEILFSFQFFTEGAGNMVLETLNVMDEQHPVGTDSRQPSVAATADVVVVAPIIDIFTALTIFTDKPEHERLTGVYANLKLVLDGLQRLSRPGRRYIIRGPTDTHHVNKIYVRKLYEIADAWLSKASKERGLVYLPVSVASWQGVEEGVLHHEDGGWHFTDGGRRWLAQSVLNGVMLSLKSDQKDLMPPV
ncbi:hypothetical protein NFJ02_25g58410 [Pycnococcus provasolii]